MQYFKLLPTSKLVDSIYGKKKDRKMYVHDKTITTSKLNESKVDLIRYLIHLGFDNKSICAYFNVSRSDINSVRTMKNFYKHTSPFQDRVGKYLLKINEEKLEVWVKQTTLEIDKFMKYYFNEHIPHVQMVREKYINLD